MNEAGEIAVERKYTVAQLPKIVLLRDLTKLSTFVFLSRSY